MWCLANMTSGWRLPEVLHGEITQEVNRAWAYISIVERILCAWPDAFVCCYLPNAPAAAVQQTGEYSVNLLLWHKHLLYQEEHTTIKEKLSHLTASMKGLLKGKH